MFQVIKHIVKYSFFLIIGCVLGSFIANLWANFIGIIAGISRINAEIIGLVLIVLVCIAVNAVVFFQQAKTSQRPYLTGAIIMLLSSLVILKLPFIVIALLAYLITTYIAIRLQKHQSIEKSIPTNGENKNIAYYPISNIKLAGLYILTFGWYKLYWWYKNWQFIKFHNNVDCSPRARCLFPIFFYHEFLQNVNQTCVNNNAKGIAYPKLLTGFYWMVMVASFGIGAALQVIAQSDPFIIKKVLPYTTPIFMLISSIFILVPQAAINRGNQITSNKPLRKKFEVSAGMTALTILCISMWLGYMSGVVSTSRSNIQNATIAMNYHNFDDAYKYASLAAKDNDPKAEYLLSEMYFVGKGVKQDKAQGMEWLEKAANQGNSDAAYQLAAMYHNGEEVAKDYKKSVYWLQKAADAGNADAMGDLGFAYNHGEGVEKNSAKAMNLYQKAAEKHSYLAMYNLGFNYGKNSTIPNHYALAASWYEKSMQEEPNPCAANDLAILYAMGQGVPNDPTKAKSLFKQAALLAFLNASLIKFDEDFSYADHREVAKAYADFAYAQATHNQSANQLSENYSPLAVRGAATMARGLQTSCWE